MKCCFRVIYEVCDNLAHFFLRPLKVIWTLPTETCLFHQVASLNARPHQQPHYFCEKLHHFSRVWTHLSWSWKHEGMFSLSLQRVAKGEMRGKWLECLPQCKHQITGAWPKLIRSETGKTSLFSTVLRECWSLPSILFGRSPLFTHISVVNVTGGIALSRESKQSCLAVLKNSNTLLRPCFVSQSSLSRRYLALLTKGHVSAVCL